MEVKTLNKGLHYLSCQLNFGSKCSPDSRISEQCFINKDVMFEMRYMQSQNPQKELLFVKFSQYAKSNNKIMYVCITVMYNRLVINKKYAVDSEWHVINETYCFHIGFNLDVTLEIEPSFEKPLSFAPLYEDTALTDFELRGDGGSVQIHGAALAAFCPTLRRMLEGNWKETQERALAIPQTSKATLQHLKDFIYLGVVPETGLENLLLLASCYMMDDLQEICTAKLAKTLKADNAVALSKFALDNNFKKLYLRILECVQKGSINLLDIKMDTK